MYIFGIAAHSVKERNESICLSTRAWPYVESIVSTWRAKFEENVKSSAAMSLILESEIEAATAHQSLYHHRVEV